jgi:hypothetical protein
LTDADAHVKCRYALDEKLGRLSGEAHNLVTTRKIVAHRFTVGSIERPKTAPDSTFRNRRSLIDDIARFRGGAEPPF